MDNFAPVTICVLNRYKHFKSCVESLAACIDADNTELFIGLDYPLKEEHWDGYKKIKEYLPEIKGFKAVSIIERDRNFGPEENFRDVRRIVFERYDRVIVSEDDNVFSASFLTFVNKGLAVYKDRPDIFAVGGYNSLPIPDWYKHEVYLRTSLAGWGIGFWRDKIDRVNWSLDSFNTMLSDRRNYKILKKYYKKYLPQLLRIRDTGVITGDGVLFLHMLQNNMYSVYPVESRVRNNGHDGSGVNCGHSKVYLNQEIHEGIADTCFPSDLQADEKLTDYIMQQIQLSFTQKIKELVPEHIRIKINKMRNKK